MKKILTLLTSLSCILFSIEVDMGAGAFNTTAKGLIKYQNNFFEGSTATVDNTPQYHVYLWTDIALPFPYDPHLLLEYGHIESAGNSLFNIQTTSEFTNTIINSAVNAFKTNTSQGLPRYATLTNNMYDAFIYTDIFDDEILPTVAFGVGLKTFNYTYLVPLLTDYSIVDDGGATIPMLYTRLSQDFEDYPITTEVGMKYYVFGDSDIYDLNAKIKVLFDVYKHVQLGAELGYKDTNFNIKGNDIDHVAGKMRYQGIFGGVIAKLR